MPEKKPALGAGIVLQPILTAILFIVSNLLRARNFTWSIPEILLYCFITVLFILVLQITLSLMFRDRIKGGLLAFAVSWFFLFYNGLHDLVFKKPIPRSHTLLLVGIILFLIIVTLILFRIKTDLSRVNVLASLVLMAMISGETLSGIYRLAIEKRESIPVMVDGNDPDPYLSHENPSDMIPGRDIFFIVFDSYTSSESLRRWWGFDNDSVETFLEENGFMMVKNSRSNYFYTQDSLASILNMRYLTWPGDRYREIKNNQVITYLKFRGYQVYSYSLFDIMDSQALFDNGIFRKGISGFYVNTALKPFYLKMKGDNRNSIVKNFYKMRTDFSIRLREPHDTPRFFYLHFPIPHFPYCFDKDGNVLKSNPKDEKSAYLEQVQFANKVMKDVIYEILVQPGPKPIIIILGDHGYRRLKDVSNDERDAESFTIFNSILMPDYSGPEPSDDLSAVNSFRFIFNSYWGADLPLLPDEQNIYCPK
jgi:hypothetical protein